MILAIDLETTGTDPATARIVEIAIVPVDPPGPPRDRRINPGVRIPPEATAVHGIADADVTGCPTFRQISRGLADVMQGACGHPVAEHHLGPVCACGHLKLAHYGTVKDGRTHLPMGCGRMDCACTEYRPEGPPVRSFCLAQPRETHFRCSCREPRPMEESKP